VVTRIRGQVQRRPDKVFLVAVVHGVLLGVRGVAPARTLRLIRGAQRHLVVGHLRSRAGFAPWLSWSRPVVPGCPDTPVHYDHGTDPPPHAISACSNRISNAEEVHIPRGSAHASFLKKALISPL